MYVYEILTKDHPEAARNHECDCKDLSIGDPMSTQVIFIGNLRKDHLDSSGRLWEDCTVYDVYVEPDANNPDNANLLIQFSGGDGCNFSMNVRGAELFVGATNGCNERSMLWAYALRLLQHHRDGRAGRGPNPDRQG